MSYPSYFQVYNASAGSGKTFTLVKEYLGLLLNPKSGTNFQRILAMTFTNKAAGEMKDRVLHYLLEFSTRDEDTPETMRDILLEETGLSPAKLREKSLEILQQILKDYSSFNIKTIDSFTNKLIKSFAFDLGLSMDFEVELDTQAIFQEAVDELISRIGKDSELTEILVSFAKDKADDDRSWDISRDLLEISRLMLNENHLLELSHLRNKELKDFKTLYKALRTDQHRIRQNWIENAQSALDLIDSKGLIQDDFSRGQVPKFFQKLSQGGADIKFQKGSPIDRNLESKVFYTKKQTEEKKQAIDLIADDLISLYRSSEELYERYKLNSLVLGNLIPLAVLNSIYKILEEIKTNNNIRLNAEFNQLISEHLRDQPAAFIYERIGEKFKYFFIDEMQDTSVLQWLNMIPLLNNALSGERAGLMLVGDAKQAIYRWRGGRAEQFIELASIEGKQEVNPFVVNREISNLETNYRSYSQIIDFNNKFFSQVSGFFSDSSYRDLYEHGNQQKFNDRRGGYVEINFLDTMKNNAERDEVYPLAVLNTLIDLLSQFRPSEICILVRKRAQGASIAKLLVEQKIEILSSETLLLKNNEKVDFIIQFLNFQSDPSNKEALFEVLSFLYKHLEIPYDESAFYLDHLDLSFDEIMDRLSSYGIEYSSKSLETFSIYEGVEAIIKGFKLNSGSDAFLQYFLDFVFDYTQRKSQKGIDFLDFWEEKKDNINIVSSEDLEAVRIMTIHKSKGLEFPVVVFPYDMEIHGDRFPKAWYTPLKGELFQDFDSLLVSATSGIQETGERGTQIYEESKREQELDSVNLLYVCLTRAVEQLYIITEKRKEQREPKYTSDLLREYLQKSGQWEDPKNRYTLGSPERLSPFSQSDNQVKPQQSLISSPWQEHNLHLVTKASLLWDTARGEAIGYGNLIHEILANITSKEDLPRVVKYFLNKGILREGDKKEVENILSQVINHPDLKAYFETGLRIVNERPILLDEGLVMIPDRLVFKQKKATIIDYKTGNPEAGHQAQIEGYARALMAMGYEIENKILVYIDVPIRVVKF